MPSRAQRKLAQQALGLSMAAPLVIAHRVGRMAQAGPHPSARDRKEFKQMGAEKMAAFYESWAAMGLAAMKSQQQMAASMWRAAATAPWSMARPSSRLPTGNTLARHALAVMSQGMAPVHRRAVSNAKRLGRLKK
jgi:hypothetical protein